MQLVTTAANELEANLLQADLSEAGIVSFIQGQTLGTARGELPLTHQTLPQIWVRDEDHERAVRIAEAFYARQQQDIDATGWNCPSCGAEVDAHFEVCWRCGMERPAS